MEVGTIHLMSFFAYAVGFKRQLQNSHSSRNNDAKTNGPSIRLWMAAPPISSPDALSVIHYLWRCLPLRVVGRQESLHDHFADDALSNSLRLLRVHCCLHDQDGSRSARRTGDYRTAHVNVERSEHSHILYHRVRDLVPAK